jgi:HK97 gp10 family phage protein
MDFTTSVRFDLAGLDEMADAVLDEAVRPAARAGALVFYQEARRAAPVYAGTQLKGRYKKKPGQLRDAIYHAFQDSSTEDLKVYRISWNKRKAPHGHLIEFGHWLVEGSKKVGPQRRIKWVPANPFMRRTYDSQSTRAVDAAITRLRELVPKAIKGVKP